MNPILIAAAVRRRRYRTENEEEEISINKILFIFGFFMAMFLIGLLIGCLFISG